MQICWLMKRKYARKVVAPSFKIGVLHRLSLNLMLNHHWMRFTLYAVAIKLFFKQFVDRFVYVKRWAIWPGNL
jgi:hypothetical protein